MQQQMVLMSNMTFQNHPLRQVIILDYLFSIHNGMMFFNTILPIFDSLESCYGNDVEIWDVVIESDSELTSANISLTPDSNFPISYTYWLINGNDTTDVTNQSDLSILLDNGNCILFHYGQRSRT